RRCSNSGLFEPEPLHNNVSRWSRQGAVRLAAPSSLYRGGIAGARSLSGIGKEVACSSKAGWRIVFETPPSLIRLQRQRARTHKAPSISLAKPLALASWL